MRWKRSGTRSGHVPPHTRQGFALPPSPRRGYESPRRRKPSPTGKVDRAQPGTDEGDTLSHSTKPGLNRQGSPPHPPPAGGTLSKQERAGSRRKRGRLPCVKGAVSRRLTEGSPCCRLGTAPHPSGLRPATLSQERVWSPHPVRVGAALMGHWPVLPAGSRPGWRRPLRWRRFSEASLPILPWTGPCPPGSRSLRRPRRRWP